MESVKGYVYILTNKFEKTEKQNNSGAYKALSISVMTERFSLN